MSSDDLAKAKKGYLTKLGGVRKNWKKRWFNLSNDGSITYFTDQDEKVYKGSFTVKNAAIKPLHFSEFGKKNAFSVEPKGITSRKYYFMAANAKEWKDWIDVLSRHGTGDGDGSILREGMLTKFTGRTRTWKRRYFMIRNKTLQYYKHAGKMVPSGEVPLVPGCIVIKEPFQSYNQNFVFSVTPSKTHTLPHSPTNQSTPSSFWSLAPPTSSSPSLSPSSTPVTTPPPLPISPKNTDSSPVPVGGSDSSSSSSSSSSESGRTRGPRRHAIVMYALSEEEMDSWIQAINHVIKEGNGTDLPKSPSTVSRFMRKHRPTGSYFIGSQAEKHSQHMYTYTHTRTHAGWLTKLGAVRRNWKKRYFVLSGSLLSYFGKEQDASPQGQQDGRLPKGDIPMEGAMVQKEPDTAYAHEFCFTIVPFGSVRKYVMYASNSVELSDWISDLDKATKGKSMIKTPTQGQGEDLSDSDDDSDSSGSDDDDKEKDESDSTSTVSSTSSTSTSDDKKLETIKEKHHHKRVMSGNQIPLPHGGHRRVLSGAGGGGGGTPPLSSASLSSMSSTSSSADGESEGSVDPSSSKEGWLTKLGDIVTTWKTRYFILSGGKAGSSCSLRYYTEKPSLTQLPKFKGSINLRGAAIERVPKEKCNKDHAFSISPHESKRTYVLISPSATATDNWISAIRKQMETTQAQHALTNPANIKEGYLWRYAHDVRKKGKGSSNAWLRQYCVLTQTKIFKSYTSHTNLTATPEAELKLAGASVQLLSEDDFDRRYTFSLKTQEGEWICGADSRKDVDEWVNIIMTLPSDEEDPERDRLESHGQGFARFLELAQAGREVTEATASAVVDLDDENNESGTVGYSVTESEMESSMR